jgi:hypothetical protein
MSPTGATATTVLPMAPFSELRQRLPQRFWNFDSGRSRAQIARPLTLPCQYIRGLGRESVH